MPKYLVKNTKYTRQWFNRETGRQVASVKLELDTETFHARHNGYYVGHFHEFDQACLAVEGSIDVTNR